MNSPEVVVEIVEIVEIVVKVVGSEFGMDLFEIVVEFGMDLSEVVSEVEGK
tara:strand:- start:2658 stop:2810 length:153 start_codon:yes stop_codon:yes gene_type:complete